MYPAAGVFYGDMLKHLITGFLLDGTWASSFSERWTANMPQSLALKLRFIVKKMDSWWHGILGTPSLFECH